MLIQQVKEKIMKGMSLIVSDGKKEIRESRESLEGGSCGIGCT